MKFAFLTAIWIIWMHPNPSAQVPDPNPVQVGTAPSEEACKKIGAKLLPKYTNITQNVAPENWVSPTVFCEKSGE